jgi:hypothetical protein
LNVFSSANENHAAASVGLEVAAVVQRAASPVRPRLHQQVIVSKISGDQIIRTPAAADVHPGSCGAYQIAIGIERVQETRFIGVSIWLNSPQRAFIYEK